MKLKTILWQLHIIRPPKIKPSKNSEDVIRNLKAALYYYSHEENYGGIARDALADAKKAGF